MLSSLATFFRYYYSPNEKLDRKEIIYRDELSNKKRPIQNSKKNLDHHVDGGSEPLICNEGTAGKGVVRVKVKMTKEEANRLLSKCKEGGVLDFADVAHALGNIPTSHIAVSNILPNPSRATVLKTISEDF